MTTSSATKIFAVPDTASLLTVFGQDRWTSGTSTVGFNPSSLTGLILWLDASRIAGISSGGSLSIWTDSSASASHATQPSAASQPTVIVAAQNGQSAVSFNATSGAGWFMTSATSLVQPTTVAITGTINTTASNRMFVGGQTSGNNGIFNVANASYGAFAGAALSCSSITANTWITGIAIFSGSSTTFSVSGVTAFGNAGTGAAALTNIGALTASTQTLPGALGEVIVYNRIITEVERASLETYLRTRWGTL